MAAADVWETGMPGDRRGEAKGKTPPRQADATSASGAVFGDVGAPDGLRRGANRGRISCDHCRVASARDAMI